MAYREFLQLECPSCKAELNADKNVDYWYCGHCGKRIDIKASAELKELENKLRAKESELRIKEAALKKKEADLKSKEDLIAMIESGEIPVQQNQPTGPTFKVSPPTEAGAVPTLNRPDTVLNNPEMKFNNLSSTANTPVAAPVQPSAPTPATPVTPPEAKAPQPTPIQPAKVPAPDAAAKKPEPVVNAPAPVQKVQKTAPVQEAKKVVPVAKKHDSVKDKPETAVKAAQPDAEVIKQEAVKAVKPEAEVTKPEEKADTPAPAPKQPTAAESEFGEKDNSAKKEFQMQEHTLIKYNGTIAKVYIPGNVWKIGSGAFKDNKTLAAVVCGDQVKEIADSAFMGCSELTEINLPPEMRKISTKTFNGCDKLKSIVIPKSIEEIMCDSMMCGLEQITFESSATTWELATEFADASFKVDKGSGKGVNTFKFNGIDYNAAEVFRFKSISAYLKSLGKCQYCGNEFAGFSKKCKGCGIKKDY